MKCKNSEQQFQELFHGITRQHSPWSAWTDFVTMAACSIANSVDIANRSCREKLYLSIREKYTAAELEQFTQLFQITVTALEENPDQDFLGRLFHSLTLQNERNGQFFTPYNIAKMMAMMMLDDPAKEIRERGHIKISDPCCGAGALLIATANALREQGINYQRDVTFVAQDIDFSVAMMCYIQLFLQGCAGYVAVGNSLLPGLPKKEDIWPLPMSVIQKMMEVFNENQHLSDQPREGHRPSHLQ